jgi:hypothetical protein
MRTVTASLALMALFCSAAIVAGAAEQQKGRYKIDGESCVWDANDSGPDQCTARIAGWFKKSGDACEWDPRTKGRISATPVAAGDRRSVN